MKIIWKHGDRSIEYEHYPMPEGRFRALCSLALAAIIGGVFLGAVVLVGVWAIVHAVVALVVYGIYRIIQSA
ncbi:MAG: hypothetical protein K2P08_00780 [Oscillospiraceae bacterium]|nr:hypothetical protein [Oscillospiraceae bacterium]